MYILWVLTDVSICVDTVIAKTSSLRPPRILWVTLGLSETKNNHWICFNFLFYLFFHNDLLIVLLCYHVAYQNNGMRALLQKFNLKPFSVIESECWWHALCCNLLFLFLLVYFMWDFWLRIGTGGEVFKRFLRRWKSFLTIHYH